MYKDLPIGDFHMSGGYGQNMDNDHVGLLHSIFLSTDGIYMLPNTVSENQQRKYAQQD